MDRLCRIESIVYVDIYRAQFKVHTDLSELLASGADSRIIVRIIFHCDVDAETEDLQDRVARASKVDRKYIEFYARRACLAVRGTRLHKIAAIDEVRRIEKEPRIQLMNDRARTIMGCDTVPEPSTLRQTNYQEMVRLSLLQIQDSTMDLEKSTTHSRAGSLAGMHYTLVKETKIATELMSAPRRSETGCIRAGALWEPRLGHYYSCSLCGTPLFRN